LPPPGGHAIFHLQLTCRRGEEKIAFNFNNSCAASFQCANFVC
jgi:hypothetical protein